MLGAMDHLGVRLGELALLAAVALGVGIVVYVGGSFLLMRMHVAPRPLSRALREALREVVWAALTQPLLPLYYVVGRRLSRGTGTPVVAVHGYSQNRVDFLRIARACARGGVGPVYGFNYPWFATLAGNTTRLARFIDRVLRETGAAKVDLVAHSLGGLLVMEYLAASGPSRVRRVVTLASPHAGVPWRGPIPGAGAAQLRAGSAFLRERFTRPVPVPCLSLYSTHDNVVHPPSTSELAHRGASDRAFEHLAHLSILFDPDVVRAVVAFLAAPEPCNAMGATLAGQGHEPGPVRLPAADLEGNLPAK